jgi:O-antigen/teichoic acid export membrane protein
MGGSKGNDGRAGGAGGAPPPVDDDQPPAAEGSFGQTRKIALGTVARSLGEVLSKVASIAFYIAIARELGDAQFGDFIFGISFNQVVLLIAGFGTEELISREAARDEVHLHTLFRDTLAVKSVLLVGLWCVVGLVVWLAGYDTETLIAVLLIGIGVGMEFQSKTYYAAFQARERMQYIAYSMVIQRTATAVAGIIVLLAGGTLIEVSVIFAAGSALGLLSARYWLHRYVVRPEGVVDRARWPQLLKVAAPLGLVSILYLALIRLDATLLAFLSDDDNAAVGHYGAAYRLVDATMFLSVAFGYAIMPWFSRHDPGQTTVSLGRGYELGLKTMIAILLPIGAFYALYASPLIDVLYGDEFKDAVVPLQFLAGMTVLFGLNTFVSIVLIARDRPGEFTRPAAIVLVQNLIFNLILIPKYGASGAAFNAVLSGIFLAALTVFRTGSSFGDVSIVRALASPAVAGVAMAGVALATSALPWLISGVLALIAYALAFLAIEKLAFPGDFRFYSSLWRRNVSPAGLGA